jgi:hypothetical protein
MRQVQRRFWCDRAVRRGLAPHIVCKAIGQGIQLSKTLTERRAFTQVACCDFFRRPRSRRLHARIIQVACVKFDSSGRAHLRDSAPASSSRFALDLECVRLLQSFWKDPAPTNFLRWRSEAFFVEAKKHAPLALSPVPPGIEVKASPSHRALLASMIEPPL